MLGGRKSLMIFQARKLTGDYHVNMDTAMFLKWLHEFFCPQLSDLRIQKHVLVLDNALYHCTAQSNGFNPKGATKVELEAYCDENDIAYRKGRPPKGDSKEQLELIVHEWQKANLTE